MAQHIRLSLEMTEATSQIITILRRHTSLPISDLRQAIANRQPFLDELPHHNQYSVFVQRVTGLLDELESAGILVRVDVNGIPESPQYLRNVFQQWHEIGIETMRISDLESGEPCIETLEWLKAEYSSDGFQQTLRQIIEGDGYACDQATVEWARREWKALQESLQHTSSAGLG